MHLPSPKKEQGFALLLALVIISIVLALGLSMVQITQKQIQLTSSTRGSEMAFHVAAAAAECIQYVRHVYPDNFLQGQAVPVDCFNWAGSGQNFTVSQPDPNHSYVYYYSYTGDWQPSGTTAKQCVGMDIYVLNNSGQTSPLTENLQGVNQTCAAGDVCTYGFALGHNVSCAQATSGSTLDTYQRELNLQF